MGSGDDAAGAAAELLLTYLSSYEGMGVARVSCTLGCSCDSLTIDAHRGERTSQRFASVYVTEKLPLRLHAERCVVDVRVDNATSSGAHKFKMSELSLRWGASDVSEAVGACGAQTVEERERGLRGRARGKSSQGQAKGKAQGYPKDNKGEKAILR